MKPSTQFLIKVAKPSAIKVYDNAYDSDIFPEHLHKDRLSLDEARALIEGMSQTALHDALGNTRLDLHGLKLKGYAGRVKSNPNLGSISKWLHKGQAKLIEKHDNTKLLGDLYMPMADVASVPSGLSGTAMHELGHAIDLNSFPNDSRIRKITSTLYRNYAPTLWQEHAAWNKGKSSVLDALARRHISPELALKTLRSARNIKGIGLGSYWGGALGGLTGAGAGVAAGIASNAPSNIALRLVFLGAMLGGGVGAWAGRRTGQAMSNRSNSTDKTMNEMVKHISKTRRVSDEDARQELILAIGNS